MALKILNIKESDFAGYINSAPELYNPLRVVEIVRNDSTHGMRYDMLLTLAIKQRQFAFAVEVKGDGTPGAATRAINQILSKPLPGYEPMIALPYLSEYVVPLLQESGVSGIDLNGNYHIVTDRFVAIRLDRPNRFPVGRSIKKIYTGNSSILGRLLLVEPGPFAKVNDIVAAIDARGGGISLATVSKALNAMIDDLIVLRRRGEINLLRAEVLLERLRRSYRPPRIERTIRLKLPDERSDQQKLLDDALGSNEWIWSGESSPEVYAVTVPLRTNTVLTRASKDRVNGLIPYEENRFYNCEIHRTEEAFPFFDRNGPWASMIETCLALSQGDKRGKEIADDIARTILKRFDDDTR